VDEKTKLLERGYGRVEDEGTSAGVGGEGAYGGCPFPPVLTKLLRLHLARDLWAPLPFTAGKVRSEPRTPRVCVHTFLRL
jgi:hypothetical protein